MPIAMPDGFNFAGGVNVDWGGSTTNQPFSVQMPAPKGYAPGQEVWLFQPVTVKLGFDRPDEQSWLVLDKMVVGTDGKMRTTSPPNLSLAGRFTAALANLFFIPSIAGRVFAMSPSIPSAMQAFSSADDRGAAFGKAISMETALGGTGGGGTKFYVITGPLGDALIPMVANIIYSVVTSVIQPLGLLQVNTTQVSVLPGQIKQYGLPLPPRFINPDIQAPVLGGGMTPVTFDFGTNPLAPSPELVIPGKFFTLPSPYLGASTLGSNLADLFVTIEVGGRDSFNLDAQTPNYVGGADTVIDGSKLSLDANGSLIVPVPPGAQLGGAYITVTRPMEMPRDGKFQRQLIISNPVQIVPQSFYIFGANGGDSSVSVFDLAHKSTITGPNGQPVSNPISDPTEIARIKLVDVGGGGARQVVPTADGTRAYVPLQTGAGVAVVDAVALQQIDADPKKSGTQIIPLPPGAQPFDAVAEKTGRYLYVSDSNDSLVYVIDIDPFSSTYNQRVNTLRVAPAPLGLRGLALSADQQRLYVTAPGETLFGRYAAKNGNLLVVDTNQATNKPPSFAQQTGVTVIPVGPEPYDITATDDPNVMLFVDRLDDSKGMGVLQRVVTAGIASYKPITYVDLRPFGQIPRLVEGRNTQVFGVTNASSIVYLPPNAFANSTNPAANILKLVGEPGYVFITGYNKFDPGDPKHDPSIGAISAYNYYYADPVSNKPIDAPLSAGSNVGIIRFDLASAGGDAFTNPRIVAATTTVDSGFGEGIALGANNLLAAAMRTGINKVLSLRHPQDRCGC